MNDRFRKFERELFLGEFNRINRRYKDNSSLLIWLHIKVNKPDESTTFTEILKYRRLIEKITSEMARQSARCYLLKESMD